jgi:hypothetical protein
MGVVRIVCESSPQLPLPRTPSRPGGVLGGLSGWSVRGIAVHIAAGIAGLAGSDEVYGSGTVTDLVAGSGLALADRGPQQLKGVPEPAGSCASAEDPDRRCLTVAGERLPAEGEHDLAADPFWRPESVKRLRPVGQRVPVGDQEGEVEPA